MTRNTARPHARRSRAAARLVFAALALASAGAAGTAEPVAVVEVRPLAPAQVAGASHEFTLHVHTFRGTRWQPDEIAAAVETAAKLLAQCGVSLQGAELRVIDAPRPFHYFDTPVSRRLLRALSTPRPAVFFVEDTKNVPAFDAETVGIANAKSRPELVNTVWVAHGARNVSYALAHELVHVLSNSGEHSHEPRNLMQAETSPQNDRLNARQCEIMRTQGEANGLLRRRNGTQ